VGNPARHIVAIASGKGGVGKSTVTVNLAAALRDAGWRVGLLDADIYGPSQHRLLGVDPSVNPEQRAEHRLAPIETHGIEAMSMGFLTTESTPMVWRGPMASSALTQLLETTDWGALDILLVDMPPGTGDIQLTLAQRAQLSGAVIVTTPQDIALIDARKGIEMFLKVKVPILGMVQNMAVHVCSACGHEDPVFGAQGGLQVAEDYAVPVLANLPLSRMICEVSDSGVPLVDQHPESIEAESYRQAAAALIECLSQQPPPSTPTMSMSDD